MKKIQLWAFCLMTALFLANCAGEENSGGSTPDSNTPPSTTNTSSVLELTKGVEAKDGEFSFKLRNVAETQVMTPEGEIKKGVAAEIEITDPEGDGWITSLIQGMEETVWDGEEVGDRPISYTAEVVDEGKQTAQLKKKIGEPLE